MHIWSGTLGFARVFQWNSQVFQCAKILSAVVDMPVNVRDLTDHGNQHASAYRLRCYILAGSINNRLAADGLLLMLGRCCTAETPSLPLCARIRNLTSPERSIVQIFGANLKRRIWSHHERIVGGGQTKTYG